jgi:hypothetical protein
LAVSLSTYYPRKARPPAPRTSALGRRREKERKREGAHSRLRFAKAL